MKTTIKKETNVPKKVPKVPKVPKKVTVNTKPNLSKSKELYIQTEREYIAEKQRYELLNGAQRTEQLLEHKLSQIEKLLYLVIYD